MKLPALQAPREWLRKFQLVHLAWALLAVWAVGLAVSFVQLDAWRTELTRSLIQLAADSQVRARVGERRDKVEPGYYRAKALSLLAAIEQMQRDATWSLFVPGTWQRFDDLEERVAQRIEQEFGEIVLETIRRELVARTAQLTGVPLERTGAALQPGADCKAPAADAGPRRLTSAVDDMPEFTAARDYVAATAELDRAVQALLSLQRPGAGSSEDLRLLVRYTLGAELPGEVSNSVTMFRTPADEVNLQPVLFLTPLQSATRCSLDKAMTALHARLLQNNELLAAERSLAQHTAGLFGGAKPLPFAQASERYRAVAALLRDQEALLAQGGNGWMRQDRLALGPAYEAMLAQVAQMRLFGPDVTQQLDGRSGAAFASFRRQFQQLFAGRPEPGIAWSEPQGRFVLSAERVQLREGLEALLAQPFMNLPEDDTSAPGAWETAIADANLLAESRNRWLRDDLPRLPEPTRAPVQKAVDTHLAQRIHDKALKAIKASAPADLSGPFDAFAFRTQRRQIAQVQEALQAMGAHWHAQRLAAQQADELAQRVQAWVAADGAGPELAGPSWSSLLSELAQDGDKPLGSRRLGEMERYLVALGPDLAAGNCAAKLAAHLPSRSDDGVDARHAALHNALAGRCNASRAVMAGPPAVMSPAALPASAVVNKNGL